jgi:hypothetical protein
MEPVRSSIGRALAWIYDLLSEAWKAASDKARELGWIV